MGLIHAAITLKNPRDASLQPLAVRALVDTGAVMLCIPEHVALQLKLEAVEQREITLADGRKRTVPYVGPVQITFENRNSFSGALVVGDGVLLGAMALEDMDLVIHPVRRTLTVDPQSPNLPSVLVK